MISLNPSLIKIPSALNLDFELIELISKTTPLSDLGLWIAARDKSVDLRKILIMRNRRIKILEGYKTLETLGKKFGVTRERIRQNERDLNRSLSKLGKIDKNSLIEYFVNCITSYFCVLTNFFLSGL